MLLNDKAERMSAGKPFQIFLALKHLIGEKGWIEECQE